MHPECAAGRIRHWAGLDPEYRKAFQGIFHHLDDFIVWGLTDGGSVLRYQWGDPEAWVRGAEAYKRLRRIEYARRRTSVELEKAVWLANNGGARGTGSLKETTVYPDTQFWISQCVEYLSDRWGASMAAFILELIDLSDLAKLCYRGDTVLAKHAAAAAIDDLRNWYHGQSSLDSEEYPV